MWTFIAGNLATILIGLAVLAIAALIVVMMVRKKKRGQPVGCGCGCAGCSSECAPDK